MEFMGADELMQGKMKLNRRWICYREENNDGRGSSGFYTPVIHGRWCHNMNRPNQGEWAITPDRLFLDPCIPSSRVFEVSAGSGSLVRAEYWRYWGLDWAC